MAHMYEPLQPGFADAQPTDAFGPSQAGVTIMMIDDDAMMTEVTQTYLEDAGYRQFVAVNDPLLALNAARHHQPSLILLDLMMPGLNGFDLLQTFRQDESLRYTPVIVLTAATDPASKLKALELGATEFLAKPVDASELKIRVRNSLAFKVYQDRLANDDPVTGLPNRRVFVEHLRQALRNARHSDVQVGLLQINIDRFRQVNASLGHAAGDAVLAAVAERLRLVARADHGPMAQRRGDGPLLARTGGDEFSLLLPELDGAEPAGRVARQMLAALNQAFSVNGHDLFVTASIGITLCPSDGLDDATLLRNAGAAIRFAKGNGGKSAKFYSAELNQDAADRLQLESLLRRALERGELSLHYQPKISLANGRMVGTEALLRWHNPELGSVPPARFIPVAEETGLIVEIGEWVVNQACTQMAQWREAAGVRIPVAVNLARHNLAKDGLRELVQGALERHGVEPALLTLELTESMLMDRVDLMSARLRELRALGVRLSIDDFGTGYSSMSYLKQFPVQELKIDRSFVVGTPDDATDVAIVRALVVLGHSLGMKVVAEGVEHEAQRAVLAELGCDVFQGFLCSKAMSAEQLLRRVRPPKAA